MSVKARHVKVKVVRAKKTTQRVKAVQRKAPAAVNETGVRVRRIDAALQRYEKACRTAVSRGEDLASLANVIGEAAVEKQTGRIIRDWCERQLLRDVSEWREAIAQHEPGSLNPRLEALRRLPDALMQWLELRFSLVPTGTVGEELEMPAARLRNYDCSFEAPTDTTKLVRVCVVAAGWKLGNAVLVPPRVRLVEHSKAGRPDDLVQENAPAR